jgi:putative colanic acid biosynthesis acetyltransferase WcaF
MFGAKVDKQATVYASCTIYAPWNLSIGRACIGPRTEIYCKDFISIGDDCVVSQGAFLCTASHDISSQMLPLVMAPIRMENWSWVAADAFVGMGVTIGEGAVVGARAAVFKDVAPWTVVGGNPAQFIKKREIRNRI